MTNIAERLKRMTCGIVLAGVSLVGGCGSNTLTWTEEVKLLDGRVITVTQKRRYDSVYTGSNYGSLPREFWLVFKLPEFADQEIVWHENLLAQVLNVYQGKLYVVGKASTVAEFRQYGRPKPPYVGYRYEAGKWQQLPFNEIPAEIYDTNLLISNEPPKGAEFVSFAMKAKEMKDETLSYQYKRIDPKNKFPID